MDFYGTLMIMCACIQNRATVKMLKSLIIVRAFEVEKPEPEAKFCSQREGNDNGRVVTGSGGKYRARESFIRKVCISE